MRGIYKTKNDLTATVTQYAPKVRQYFGHILIRGYKKETQWDTDGMNLENPEWDIDRLEFHGAKNANPVNKSSET